MELQYTMNIKEIITLANLFQIKKNPTNEGSGIFYLIDTIQFAIKYSNIEQF